MKKKLLIIIISICTIILTLCLIFIPKLLNNTKELITPYEVITSGKIVVDDNGKPKYIEGSNISTKVEDKDDVYSVLDELKGVYGFEKAKDTFDIISINEVGSLKYYKVEQKYNYTKIFGKQLVVTVNENNEVLSVTGEYYDVSDVSTSLYLNKVKEKFIEKYPTAEIINAEKYYYINDGTPIIAGIIEASSEDGYYNYVLDKDGNVIDKLDLTYNSSIDITTKDAQGKEVTITLDNSGLFKNDYYEYYDENRNIKIIDGSDIGFEFSEGKKVKYGTLIYYLLTKSRSNPITVLKDNEGLKYYSGQSGMAFEDDEKISVATSAMYNLSKSYDYYKNVLGRNGYDNNNADIRAFIGVKSTALGSEEYQNACWNGSGKMFVFGSMDDLTLAADIDIVGHEYTHAVTGSIIDLIYQGESGALSEGYSDIMGSLIEDKNFIMGDSFGQVRNLTNPNSKEDPAAVGEKYYFPSDLETYNEEWQEKILKYAEENGSPLDDWKDWDHGGVHTNGNVPGHAAYLMYKNKAFSSKEEMAKVWYNSMFMLSSSADFEDCALAVIQSAKNLGLKEEKINIITKAFVDTKMLADNDYKVSGKVIDKDTNKPIEGALVSIALKINPYVNFETTTDNKGNYSFDSIPGMEYEITFTKPKYNDQTKSLKLEKDTNDLNVKMVKIDEEDYSEAEIVFVLDISASMDDSDPGDIRKQIMANILYSLDSNYSFSLITFSGTANVVNSGMSNKSNDKKILMTDIFNIANDNGHNDYSGTNGRAALTKALTLFKKENKRKYIVFLTDGVDTVESDKTYEEIISEASNNKIRILSIGLGTDDLLNSNMLEQLASSTGGKYYNAEESNILYKFNKTILEELE